MTALTACQPDPEPAAKLAEDVFAPLGEPLPSATDEQLETFARGREVALHRHTPEEGLGPLINVSACADCHERPVLGGSAPRYRDFFLMGTKNDDGSFMPAPKGGVLDSHGLWGAPLRPAPGADVNVIAQRSAIAMFGVGLLAELPPEAILIHEDPDDLDGDGISGRANYDRGFVGRFGRKSQTVSIEGFIRGPLNNHIGLTTDPLGPEDLARLPVPSVPPDEESPGGMLGGWSWRQAAAPAEPLTDTDPIPDPEMPSEDLFDLVSFAMLLAAPLPDTLEGDAEEGFQLFSEIGCEGCHVATLEGPRGLLPLYSDLLLHDMGPELADGIEQGLAGGAEFRTQPLWGIVSTGPFMHDGRADTLEDAVILHGGEATSARDAFVALSESDRAKVIAFMTSLGGAELVSPGLLGPADEIPAPGQPGAPLPMSDAEYARWLEGRAMYDADRTLAAGLGPLFNGDSCRACHTDPVMGGAGPLDLDVMRYGGVDGSGVFEAPADGTVLHRIATVGNLRPEGGPAHNVFEPRQTPTNLGLGLIESIAEEDILAGADPDDENMDGIRGRPQILADGRLGRFGWKAQVPSVREFVRDAMSVEIGVTVPDEDGFTFGTLVDSDDAPDPEISSDELDTLAAFLLGLDAPQAKAEIDGGLALFESIGCALCHTPELPGTGGPVPLFSDLLLHEILDDDEVGIVDGLADMRSFRTPPLWGISETAPYMHDGRSSTLEDAIAAHGGEATGVRDVAMQLAPEQRALLIAFLSSL